MKKSNILVVVILALSAVLFVSGVVKKIRHSRVRQQQRKMLAVIPKGTANMWWDTVRLGAQAAAEKGNADMVWTGPEMETDREKQIQAVDDMLVKNVDAVVLGPNDFNALARSVDKIKEKGIPCIIIDSPVRRLRGDGQLPRRRRGGTPPRRRPEWSRYHNPDAFRAEFRLHGGACPGLQGDIEGRVS